MSDNEDLPIPFIDDVEEHGPPGEPSQRQYNLTITRNYQNKTRRVEISKILQDAEPVTHRSLSPVAPLANDAEHLTDEEEGGTLTGAEFELTIKSNNSIIRIQGYDNKSTISFKSGKGGNVYDLISKEVDKIFRKPEREEIERVMKNLKDGERRIKQKKSWKVLTKSMINAGRLVREERRGSVERYPKMVLLQDVKPQTEEENYPKMVMIDERDGIEKEMKGTTEDAGRFPEKGPTGERKPKKVPERKKKTDEGARQRHCEDCGGSVKHPKLPESCFHPSFGSEDFCYSTAPPFRPPLYVPFYNGQIPCCGGRIQKDNTTQTESEMHPPCEEAKEINDLPLEFLSSFFPRIVVMKSFQEEVPGEDSDTKIFEIPKNETPAEKEDEEECEDLGERAEEEPPFREDVEEDEGGKPDDFREEKLTNEELPLTKIGYTIYDKLNELAIERKKGEERAEKETEKETEKSPRNITFEVRNKLVRFTLAEDKANLELEEGKREGDKERNYVTDDKMVVRKSKLWYPSAGERIRKDQTPGKDLDEVSLSISQGQNLVFSFEMGTDSPGKKMREAKVGTDGTDLAGGDFTPDGGSDDKDLSPRTDEILKSLRNKLETIEGARKRNGKNRDFKFPGLFLIQPFDRFPAGRYPKPREREARMWRETDGKPREYYCEECLATMRLFEDEKVSVKNMVDKFETIIHLGSY